MAKQIVFTYEDKEYTLEFTRRTVKQMEDAYTIYAMWS